MGGEVIILSRQINTMMLMLNLLISRTPISYRMVVAKPLFTPQGTNQKATLTLYQLAQKTLIKKGLLGWFGVMESSASAASAWTTQHEKN